jgi:hypothetical protein
LRRVFFSRSQKKDLRQKTSAEEEENLRSPQKETGNGDKSRKLTSFFTSRFVSATTVLHRDIRKDCINEQETKRKRQLLSTKRARCGEEGSTDRY